MLESSNIIRRACKSDLAGLLELYAILHDEEMTEASDSLSVTYEQMLSHPGLNIFIALNGSRPVSTATLIIIPNLTRNGKPYGLIENVVTHADWRGRSYGTNIINHSVERAWQAGCYKVMLLTGRQDPATLRFYQGCGLVQNKTGFQIRNPQ
jgi:GNAT superfamily N-acetyltransferase